MVVVKMSHKARLVLLLLVLSILFSFSAVAVEDDCIHYFYGEECSDCALLKGYFIDLVEKYPDLEIKNFEVYHNYKNFKTLQNYFNSYNVDRNSQQIPAVFTGEGYFIGKKSIKSFLEDRILNSKNPSCPSLEEDFAIGLIGEGEPHNIIDRLTFFVVTGKALQNIFAPGIIALVLLLLIFISLIEDRESMFKKGILYITGVYVGYLLFGIGFGSIFYNSSLLYFFYKSIGLVAIIFGLVGIKTFFGTWEWLLKSIPTDLRKYIENTIRILLSSPGIFAIGFITSLFTVASISDTFFLMRDLFIGGFMRSSILPLIIYYNLILISIFVAVLLLFNFLRRKLTKHVKEKKNSSDKKEKIWDKHYSKVLNLLVRLFILVIGLILLFV